MDLLGVAALCAIGSSLVLRETRLRYKSGNRAKDSWRTTLVAQKLGAKGRPPSA